ncbi:Cof-type HAD-IIB family hydrolase [Virgibacillus sp. YIM 98842]|uniref:Cof-type HAD-IIB family hydrolase n=1 Tax=Virgibacillus sp. YIM 98842 TaxID=2663533 RepID=UPI0013DCA790|nr:Cof-type HAD-IIB family hydrolase [Virgibacillus sp. YIM 98842]
MKLIATDLDGTLLDENGLVSGENAAAIKKAIDLGIAFVVATGRSFDAANLPLQHAGLRAPIISLNGANTYTADKELLRDIPMDAAQVKMVHDACLEKDLYFEVFTNKGVFSTSREYFLGVMLDILKSANPNLPEEELRKTAELRFQYEDVEFIESYESIFADKEINVYKILGFSMEKSKLDAVHKQLINEKGIAITSSGGINIEFNHVEAQKGTALEQYADSLGIQMKDVMAIGDNLNDASMLKTAGRSVAMGNAADEIKTLSDFMTGKNTENGVADAIEDMLKEVKN